MGRLIIVSNRTPAPGERTQPAGGLTVGLCDAVQTQETLWFGWSGHQHADAADRPVQSEQVGNVNYVTFDLTQRQYDRFYLNFSNGVLWPLCHYRTNLIRYTREDCDAYYEANEVFADRLVGLLEPDDTVWIHDYHLFPLGKMLRDRGVTGRIGFFLHIPFPPWSVARLLPRLDMLLSGLAACDLIGVQTPEDATNLKGCFEIYGLKAAVEAVPIGIDPVSFRQQAIESASSDEVVKIMDTLEGTRLIMGVDRLDYSKGLPERMKGFEALLKNYPEHRGQVTFLQVTPVSRGGRGELSSAQGRAGRAGRDDQRRLWHAGLGADPLHDLADRAAYSCRALPDGRCGVCHAAAGWHEPRGQGVHRGAGRGRSRRAGAVAVCGGGSGNARGASDQSAGCGRDGRCASYRPDHGRARPSCGMVRDV